MSEHKIDAILTPEEKATLAGLVSVYPGIKDFVAGVIDRLSEGRLDEMLAYMTKPEEDVPELLGSQESGPGPAAEELKSM